MNEKMRWYHYLAIFWGGGFLVNALPHFMSGISGHPFQSPFATPPGEGLSSAKVNVTWAIFNFFVAYLLLVTCAKFKLTRTSHILTFSSGGVAIAYLLAYSFGRFYGGA